MTINVTAAAGVVGGAAVPLKATLVAAVLAMAGCSGMMNTPTAQSVAGLSPSGNVTITEDFVTGVGGGSGSLDYQGRIHPFKVIGTVAGPGGGVEKISASGPVYKLASVSDFPGRYTQAPARPVSAHPAAAICGWRTAPA
jgi:hypothetical protein